MRKFVYFIERTDTNEWLYTKEVWQETGFSVHDGFMGLFLDWTNDPFKAEHYSSKKEAMATMVCGLHCLELRRMKDVKLIITEHEFVISPIKP